MQDPQMAAPDSEANPYYLAVDALDITFLKKMKAVVGLDLRLWWDPMAKRGQKPVEPTHVTIMSDNPSNREKVLAALLNDRANREKDGKAVFANLPTTGAHPAEKPNAA